MVFERTLCFNDFQFRYDLNNIVQIHLNCALICRLRNVCLKTISKMDMEFWLI